MKKYIIIFSCIFALHFCYSATIKQINLDTRTVNNQNTSDSADINSRNGRFINFEKLLSFNKSTSNKTPEHINFTIGSKFVSLVMPKPYKILSLIALALPYLLAFVGLSFMPFMALSWMSDYDEYADRMYHIPLVPSDLRAPRLTYSRDRLYDEQSRMDSIRSTYRKFPFTTSPETENFIESATSLKPITNFAEHHINEIPDISVASPYSTRYDNVNKPDAWYQKKYRVIPGSKKFTTKGYQFSLYDDRYWNWLTSNEDTAKSYKNKHKKSFYTATKNARDRTDSFTSPTAFKPVAPLFPPKPVKRISPLGSTIPSFKNRVGRVKQIKLPKANSKHILLTPASMIFKSDGYKCASHLVTRGNETDSNVI